MLERNSYSGTDVSAPDHLGTRELRKGSLRTVCMSRDTCCFNLAISALDISSSARSLTTAKFTNKIHLLIESRILNFVLRYFSYRTFATTKKNRLRSTSSYPR